MNPKFSKILWGLLVFYIVSLTCSIAGMEAGASLFTLAIIFGQFKWGGLVKKLGPDYFLWGFWLIVILGAVLLPDFSFDVRKEIAGSPRSVLTLYAASASLLIFRPYWDQILKILFGATSIVSIYGIIQFFTGLDMLHSKPYRELISPGVELFRTKGFYTNTMTYSYLFGMIFCLFFAFVLFQPRERYIWLWRAGLALVGISLVMTFTRGLWIALILAVLSMTALVSRKFFIRTLLVLVVSMSSLYILSPQVRVRVANLVHLDQSNSQRLQIWQVNWQMFKDHPLLGVGYEQNSTFVQDYNIKMFGKPGFTGHAHNHFLQILAGTGIFGFLCFMGFCIYFFWMSLRLWKFAGPHDWLLKAVAMGSLGAQALFHIGGLSEAVYVDRESNHMFIFVCALTVVGMMDPATTKWRPTKLE